MMTSASRKPGCAGGDRRHLGARGEALAAEHLERLGFALLARNVRTRHGEIDLIAFDGRVLAFVEVKSRTQVSGGPPNGALDVIAPLEGLGLAQRRRLRRLAAAWLGEHRPRVWAQEIRFDAIGVRVDARGELRVLEHIEGAW